MSKQVPQKESDVIGKAIMLWESGQYIITPHAIKRMQERNITTSDIYDCLLSSSRSENDDRFNEQHGSWTYSLKGFDEENNNIELIIALKDKVIFVTVLRVL
jgi:hypothetical protein